MPEKLDYMLDILVDYISVDYISVVVDTEIAVVPVVVLVLFRV